MLIATQRDSSVSVSSLPPEVQASDKLQFALQVAMAASQHSSQAVPDARPGQHNQLVSCGYVKFFRLFRRAALLPACAMHRILTAVRVEAVQVMADAYRSKTGEANVRIDKFAELLAFNSTNEALEFAAHYGKDCSSVRQRSSKHRLTALQGTDIDLNSNVLAKPPKLAFPMTQSQCILDQLTTAPLPDLINGAPLPAHTRHVPSYAHLYLGGAAAPPPFVAPPAAAVPKPAVLRPAAPAPTVVVHPKQPDRPALAPTAATAAQAAPSPRQTAGLSIFGKVATVAPVPAVPVSAPATVKLPAPDRLEPATVLEVERDRTRAAEQKAAETIAKQAALDAQRARVEAETAEQDRRQREAAAAAERVRADAERQAQEQAAAVAEREAWLQLVGAQIAEQLLDATVAEVLVDSAAAWVLEHRADMFA